MARATLADRLGHILRALESIRTFTAGKSLADYRRDVLLRRAVERCIEIVSEASRHVPADLQATHSEIPWRNVADLGNVLRHGYDQVASERIWQIVEEHLEPLEKAARDLIARMKSDEEEG